MTNNDETTNVADQPVVADGGGLVAPATQPIPGTIEHEDFLLTDPGLLPAPDPDTRVDGIEHPIEPQRFSIGMLAGDVGRFVSIFWAMSVLWLVVFSMLPMLVGWSPTVVTTGSMSPAISPGTIVHVDGGVDPQILGPGAIITYDDPNIPGRKVTHRVVEVVRETEGGPAVGFATKGDANVDRDREIVPIESVDGATRLVLPYAGLPQVWLAEGKWWLVLVLALVTAVAGVVALDTVAGFVTGRTMFRRRSVATAVAIAIAVMLGGPASNAAFAASTDNTGNGFEMTSQWYLDAIDADGPIAHWQLNDAPSGGTGSSVTVVNESFESPVSLTQFGSGQVAASTAQARTGSTSIHKTNNNDPNGGWALLPSPITDSFTFDVWVFRPSTSSGGSVDRLGLEDASFNGYTFYSAHSNNQLRIDRRTNGGATTISGSASFDPPEDAWYRLRLEKSGSNLVASAFDGGGSLLATISAVDATYSSFDRWTIRGGHDYFVDDLTITQEPTPGVLTAVDRIGTENGVPAGVIAAGQPALLTNQPGAASAFEFNGSSGVLIGDDPLINTTTRPERTVELWFEANSVSGRQVLYEEGGGTNGINLYLDGGQLHGRAWGRSLNWSNDLGVSTGPTAIAVGQRHHVAIVLDAVGDRSVELYLDGALVGTDTKTDAAQWNAHSDDAAIARVNGGTRYHDGTGGGANGFDGSIDEVVLFNTALDADRIEAHWFAGR